MTTPQRGHSQPKRPTRAQIRSLGMLVARRGMETSNHEAAWDRDGLIAVKQVADSASEPHPGSVQEGPTKLQVIDS